MTWMSLFFCPQVLSPLSCYGIHLPSPSVITSQELPEAKPDPAKDAKVPLVGTHGG